MPIRFVYMTAGSLAEAQNIGRGLVSAGLAACINIFPHMNSIYTWEGKIEEASEVVMIAKTTEARIAELIAKVKSCTATPSLHRQPGGGRRLPAVSGVDRRQRQAMKVSPLWERLPASITSRQDAAPTEKRSTSLKAGYAALRHHKRNEVTFGWLPLSRAPLP